jgi:3-dehydroquinate synthase
MIIKSNIRDYSVEFVETDEFMKGIIDQPDHVFIIDGTVWDLYKESVLQKISTNRAIIQPIHEDLKNLETVTELYDHLVNLQAKRNVTLVVIGGGILQDICGYVASTIYRGIHWIFVPTTLLAQADSCIGSKTSLNYKNYKNLIGTFYPPSEIFIYPKFLFTLSGLDYYSGLGEIIKLHIMAGTQKIAEIRSKLPLLKKKDFSTLKSVIEKSLQIKKEYIEEDEFDSGRRNLLNYGHCFGHAIETISNFAIPHGQAVVIGMILANSVACSRGLLSPETNDCIYEELLKPSLIISRKQLEFNTDDLIKAMKKDKKRTGINLALIMMCEKFHFIRVSDLSDQEVQKAISELHNTTPW